MPDYKLIPIEQLVEPEIAARAGMDESKLHELADSVREIGFIQPLAVVPDSKSAGGDGAAGRTSKTRKERRRPRLFEIVDGHRRYKAAIMLKLTVVPCMVFADKETARQAIKLHANLYREDLSPAEEAAFLADLIEKYDYTEEQLCKSVRQSVSWVNARLALLTGNPDVLKALEDRKINMAVAQQLNRCTDAVHCKYLLTLAIDGGATMATVARWVAEWKQQLEAAAAAENTPPAPAVTEPVTAPLPECILCRGTHNPYNLQPALVHDYCKVSLDVQIANAAKVQVAEPGTPGDGGKADARFS